ncbi:MAG: hypothetical protein K1V80_08170 [Muribaculaceae bacterium]
MSIYITHLFQISIATSILLFLMWSVYHIALSTENKFTLNRITVIAIYGLSIAGALFLFLNLVPADYTVQNGPTHGLVVKYTPVISQSLKKILSYVWLAGAVSVLLSTVVEIFRVNRLLKKCDRTQRDGFTIFISPDRRLSPFSFWNKIIMNRNDFEENFDPIFFHEHGHILNRHTTDTVIAQLFVIFCWYNPAAWLIRSDLKSVHEYQADCHALNTGINIRQYQLLLLEKAIGSKFPSICNNLNHSKLEKRIVMINRTDSRSSLYRLRYLLPMAALCFGFMIMSTPTLKAMITPEKELVTVHGRSNKSSLDGVSIYVDGKLLPSQKINDISPNTIEAISVDKNKSRIDITTKQ